MNRRLNQLFLDSFSVVSLIVHNLYTTVIVSASIHFSLMATAFF